MIATNFDAIIVGAGPAGSSAAILLARAGWLVALVEKQSFPRRKVCGECIAASNLPLLDALGVGAAFAASAGSELRQFALMQGEHSIKAALPAAAHYRHAWGKALGRETLDTLLLDQARATGVVVLQPWSVQEISGVAGDHRCDIRAVGSDEKRTLHAPILIAANGSWEALPSARSARRLARKPSDLFAFKANFQDTALEEGVLPVLSFNGGYGGMVLADQGLGTLAFCIRADQLEICRRESPGLSAGEAVEAYLKRECHGVAAALASAQRVGAWMASGPIDPGIRLNKDDTLFRIGNAAGEAHPIIGEGMSMAMQSAWLLCAQLLQSAPPLGRLSDTGWQRSVQHRYAAEWRRHFAPRLRLAAAFAHVAMRPDLASPLLAVVRRWPALLTQGARWGGKIKCAASPATIAWLASGADTGRSFAGPVSYFACSTNFETP
ncbi:flavin-dependent dehydrogenase [Polaromonas sp. CG_9.5]|uniref:NAD(P)/FAD-dependent oxidoreductase n=1 Tax=Polaromonas sp. CG_9.5 TaxID=3071705 RepID=UPI002E023F12|nr:flavin-dependent dehydrogenase [Polaromonas sp. CG_9.5]